MGVGVLSIVCATNLQKGIIMCNTPLEIRLWLSRGARRPPEEVPYEEPFNLLPLESSCSAAMMCELPAQMLEFAMALYFAGFGLYLLFYWINKVDSNVDSSRNVFIFFIVVLGLFSVQMVNGQALRDRDRVRRTREFAPKDRNSFVKCQSLKILEDELAALQTDLNPGPDKVENLATLKKKMDDLSAKWKADQSARKESLESERTPKMEGEKRNTKNVDTSQNSIV